jgi:hypothetical protein
VAARWPSRWRCRCCRWCTSAATLATNAGLLALSLVVYAALLVWQRVITPDELRALQRAARVRGVVEVG